MIGKVWGKLAKHRLRAALIFGLALALGTAGALADPTDRPIWPIPPGYIPSIPMSVIDTDLARKPRTRFGHLPLNALDEPGGPPEVVQRGFGTEPILRPELSQHSGEIDSLDVDASGDEFITGSWDKTARVWKPANGSDQAFRLVQVLRPPMVDDPDTGKILAVALSPDGTKAAVGGRNPVDEQKKEYGVYIFDVATGKVEKTLRGFPNPVQTLTYSKNGAYLAIGLYGPGGLFIVETDHWRGVGRDSHYADRIFGLDFASDGRLATASWDGNIRLYTPGQWREPSREIAGLGQHPVRIAFDPAGTNLAVGYDGAGEVDKWRSFCGRMVAGWNTHLRWGTSKR